MSEKRLSNIMSDSSRAIADAQDVLDEAITNAIHIHFDAGVTAERERIIKLLEEYLSAFGAPQEQLMQRRMADFIALIKGENK